MECSCADVIQTRAFLKHNFRCQQICENFFAEERNILTYLNLIDHLQIINKGTATVALVLILERATAAAELQ